jgi:hypothetical protein
MADHRPVVSFRTDADTHLKLEQLRATFPKQQWSEVFTWLLADPTVVAVITNKVHGS